MTTKKDLQDILSRRILVLDGATGTMIQKFGLTEEDYRGERFLDHPYLLKGNNLYKLFAFPRNLKNLLEQDSHSF